VIGGGVLVKISFELGQTSSAMSVPIGVVYGVLPVSGVMMLFYCVDAILSKEGRPAAPEREGV
jgi:TRAP-type C4-dicarboxylate transport system permease small subunit